VLAAVEDLREGDREGLCSCRLFSIDSPVSLQQNEAFCLSEDVSLGLSAFASLQGYKHQTCACESQHLHGLLSRNLHKVSVNDCGEFSESLQLARVQCFMNSGKCGKNCRKFHTAIAVASVYAPTDKIRYHFTKLPSPALNRSDFKLEILSQCPEQLELL
ncbi:hypothetical protein U0070_003667, partial [Myodes glareolus]